MPESVRLIGAVPPEGTLERRWMLPSTSSASSEIELSPAFTAKKWLLVASKTSAPWLPRPVPVPAPPVGYSPNAVRAPVVAERVY